MKSRLILFFALSFISKYSFSQDINYGEEDIAVKKSYWKKHFKFGGYVKYMNTNSFTTLDSIYTDNLFHNRLNLKYNPNSNWSVIVEVRNRLFYGESVKYQPAFSDNINTDNGIIDLSFNIIDAGSMILNSTIDRAYVEYNKNKWNVRIGRQRVNWGINLAWNPNDLFNAYNFTDFDYSERPGTDGIRIQYYNKPMAKFELAYKPGKNLDQTILSALYKFNKKSYDIQFLASNYNTDLAAGLGWAGNLWTTGFKGEATYFHPKQSINDTIGVLATSISLDYTFKNGTYLNIAGLYNGSAKSNTMLNLFNSPTEVLSAKNLLPSEFTAFVQVSKSISPIFGGGISVMYLPTISGLFINPSLNYSIAENWGLDAIGQFLFAKKTTQFSNLSNAVFLRLRWSF